MKNLSKIFFTGLVVTLPLMATLYILHWLGGKAEAVFGNILQVTLPQGYYWPGMGLVAGFVFVLMVGIMMRAYLFRRLVQSLEQWFTKLPLIKTLYGSIRDLMQFASSSKEGQGLGQVVMITWEDRQMSILGFLTNDNVRGIAPHLPADCVAVYLPLSYQIGGLTVLVPRSQVKPIKMSVNDAMRFSITAGMVAGNKSGVETEKF